MLLGEEKQRNFAILTKIKRKFLLPTKKIQYLCNCKQETREFL